MGRLSRSGIVAFFLLALSGCSPSTRPVAVAPDLFQPAQYNTKIFVFSHYDGALNVPLFGESFRLNVNGSLVGSFSNKQFMELEIPTGDYVFDAYQTDWMGDVVHQAKATVRIPNRGQLMFFAVVTHLDQSISLSLVSAEFGMTQVRQRAKAETQGTVPSAASSLP